MSRQKQKYSYDTKWAENEFCFYFKPSKLVNLLRNNYVDAIYVYYIFN